MARAGGGRETAYGLCPAPSTGTSRRLCCDEGQALIERRCVNGRGTGQLVIYDDCVVQELRDLSYAVNNKVLNATTALNRLGRVLSDPSIKLGSHDIEAIVKIAQDAANLPSGDVSIGDLQGGFRTLGLLSQALISNQGVNGSTSDSAFPIHDIEDIGAQLLEKFEGNTTFGQDFDGMAVFCDASGGRRTGNSSSSNSSRSGRRATAATPGAGLWRGYRPGLATRASPLAPLSLRRLTLNATGGAPVGGLFTLFFTGADVTEERQVELELPVPANATGKLVCVFFDAAARQWSADGVTTVSTGGGKAVCKSAHLSSFAVIVSQNAESADTEALRIITYVGLSLSLFCLLLIMLTFILFKSLRKQPQRILLNLAAALFAAQLLFIAGVDQANSSNAACQVCACVCVWECGWVWGRVCVRCVRCVSCMCCVCVRAVCVFVGNIVCVCVCVLAVESSPECLNSCLLSYLPRLPTAHMHSLAILHFQAVAILLHYFLLATFFWTLVEGYITIRPLWWCCRRRARASGSS